LSRTLILVVDGNADARARTVAMLRTEGMSVIEASHDRQGLDLAVEQDPDVVLVRANPAGASRFALCQELRTHPVLRDTPTVLVADRPLTDAERVAGFQAGAMGLLVEPYPESELLALVSICTRLSEARRQARESEARAQALLNAPQESSVLIDRRGTVLACNSAAARQLGRSVADLVGRCLFDHLSAALARSRKVRVESVFLTGLPVRFEDQWEDSVYDNSVYPVTANDMEVSACALFTRDVTDRKRGERALRMTEQQHRQIFEAVADALLIFDMDGRIIEANPAACAMYGHHYAEFIGKTGKDIVHPDYHHLFANFKAQAGTLGRFFVESVDLRKDGSPFHVEVRGTTVPFQGRPHLLAVIRDISEQKRAQRALRESEERFRTLAEFAPDCVFWRAADGRVVHVTPACEQVTGYTARDLAASPTSLDDLIHAEDRQQWAAHRETELTEGTSYPLEFRIVTRAGDIRWVGHVCRPIIDGDGACVGTCGSFRDVSRRKEAEIALRQSEERYRRMVAAVSSYHYRVWVEHGVAKSTEHGLGCHAVTGYTPEDYAKNPNLWFNMIHPQDRQTVLAHVARVLAGQSVPAIEHRIIHRHGEALWVRDTIVPHHDARGELTCYDGVVEDITFRKQAEESLRRSEQRFRAIADYTCDWESWIDPGGALLWVSPAVERIVGYTPAECQAMPDYPQPLIHEDDRERIAQALREAVRTRGSTNETRLRIRRKDGTTAWAAASWQPIFDVDGQYLGIRSGIRDITARKRAEDELIEARILAETANQELESTNRQLEQTARQACELAAEAKAAAGSKSEFLASMSHEIRTPMSAILGFAESLLEADLSADERTEAIRTILRNGEHLLSLLNNVLDLSKIESGRLDVEFVDCSVPRLLEDVQSLMKRRADAKGLAFETRVVEPMPNVLQTDPTRLRQILINLVGNAIKFTAQGSVRLTARLNVADQNRDSARQNENPVQQLGSSVRSEPSPHGAPRLEFEITDTGIGMSQEQLSRLFRPFTQADASTTRQYGGTGLGLAISQQLARLLGGDIEAESIPNQGSAFRVTIAVGPPENAQTTEGAGNATGDAEAHANDVAVKKAPPDAQPNPQPLRDCHVLLAEDGPDNRLLIMRILQKAGATVTAVETGQVAVEAAMANRRDRDEPDPGKPFDLILMDVQMPVLDGLAAARQLRARGYTGPIIALTAHALPGDRARCLAAGCDDYASKPINRHRLLELVRRYATRKASSRAMEARDGDHVSPAEARNRRIQSADSAPGGAARTESTS